MSNMFCFQCEQTAGGKSCTGKAGVCGKQDTTANFQDKLTGALIGLSRAAKHSVPTDNTHRIMMEGLFTTVTNVSFNDSTLQDLIEEIHREKEKLYAGAEDIDMNTIWNGNEDIRSLKSLILFGIRGMAAYAYHAYVLGYTDNDVNQFFYEALSAIGEDSFEIAQLLPIVLKTGEINLKCMELLNQANTESYGTPVPVTVPLTVEKGPFIVVSGHDLLDLKQLLEQTKDKGINIYTHGEMLPAHGYPKLKEYPHLKGNFGTAWQNQQKEFLDIPAPVLFTTNCLMPVKDSYRDRVFTTAVVSYPEMVHIDERKDFTPVIEKALELGGYSRDTEFTGINGGKTVTTGFSHGTVLSVADKVIDAVKAGDISHFFLVGGCDGAKPGRNYYTDFVKQTPEDSIILTLACGKYRFNDLNLGEIGGLPRIMDMGQCNDAYSAIKVAIALAEAFDCGVNDLPLTLVLSWYEQKAVCILLTLLHLGIKNILLGPTLPAFVSPNILNFLVENYALTPISTPEEDLKKILG
ncbi:hydroxylamine reductase [Aequitasia blattaphilus]|uniref:Hydroxylamine reductase n=2 Tax=Aequitasia blattaphilus TaxID=2949332 RepID=A0ABT1EBV5_9FIRM|nr:hydroxylamine reductase [Aequitasia blattaphilus]MCP1103319.1 hydroxylamine reductase [Aequitasia blattaphilus]MCR8615959.1 hydroxylamine reductase [Aequitasia blattaphilus]